MKIKTSVSLDEQVHRAVKKAADREERSVSQFVERFIKARIPAVAITLQKQRIKKESR